MPKDEQQQREYREYSGHGGTVKKSVSLKELEAKSRELQSLAITFVELKDERAKKMLADLAEMMFVLGVPPEQLQILVLMLFNYEVFDEFTIFRRDLMPEEIEPAVDIEHEPIILSPHRWPPRPLEAAELAERLAKQWRSESEDAEHKRWIRRLDKILATPPTMSIEEWAHRHRKEFSRATVYNYRREAKVSTGTRARIEAAILSDAQALGLFRQT